MTEKMKKLIISRTEPSKMKAAIGKAVWHEVEATPIEFYGYCLDGCCICHSFSGHNGVFRTKNVKNYEHFKQAHFLWVDIDAAPKETNINFDTLTERLSRTKLCPTFVYETFSCGEKEKGYNACLRAVFVVNDPITDIEKYKQLCYSLSEYVYNLYPECTALIESEKGKREKVFDKKKVFDSCPNAAQAMNGTDGTRRRHKYYGNVLNTNEIPTVNMAKRHSNSNSKKKEYTVNIEDKEFESDTKRYLGDIIDIDAALNYFDKYKHLKVPNHTPYIKDANKNYTVLPEGYKSVTMAKFGRIRRDSQHLFIYGKQLMEIHPDIKPVNMLYMLVNENDSLAYHGHTKKKYYELYNILDDIYNSTYKVGLKERTILIKPNSKDISYNQAVEEYKTDIINETFDHNLSETENYGRFIEKSVVPITQATYHKRILKMGLSTPTAKKAKTVSRKIKPDITKYIDLTLSVRKNIEYIKEKYGIEVSRGTMHDTMKKMKTIGIINTKVI